MYKECVAVKLAAECLSLWALSGRRFSGKLLQTADFGVFFLGLFLIEETHRPPGPHQVAGHVVPPPLRLFFPFFHRSA